MVSGFFFVYGRGGIDMTTTGVFQALNRLDAMVKAKGQVHSSSLLDECRRRSLSGGRLDAQKRKRLTILNKTARAVNKSVAVVPVDTVENVREAREIDI